MDPARVLDLVRRHGWNTTSFQILAPGFSYFADGDDACVAYVDTGRAWVAAGAPVAPEDRLATTAQRFVEAARRHGRRAAFFATEDRFTRAPLVHLRIGEQAHWDPRRWEDTLRDTRSLREQLRRARARGATVRQLREDEIAGGRTRDAAEELIRRWLASRPMAPMGFLVRVHPFRHAGERRCFVAELDGRVVGFLAAAPIPARRGWLLENVLRDPSAPNGTVDLLIDAAMRAAADQGAERVTLGLAPLAGHVARPLRMARRLGAGLFRFEGLRAFKARLRPQGWDPVFVSFPHGTLGATALVDTLSAFAHGGLLRFGLETLLRGPALVLRVLALLLIPWTVLLAIAPGAWFPSPAAQAAWVIFDVVLAAALLWLVRTWRPWLATALAVLVSADAALTAIQALVWNLPRARDAGELAVIALAVLAPGLAAALLWLARAHRSLWM